MLQLHQVARVRSRGGWRAFGRGGDRFPSVQQELLALRTMAPPCGAKLAATRETGSLPATFIFVSVEVFLARSGCKGLHRPTRGTCARHVYTSLSRCYRQRPLYMHEISETLDSKLWCVYPLEQGGWIHKDCGDLAVSYPGHLPQCPNYLLQLMSKFEVHGGVPLHPQTSSCHSKTSIVCVPCAKCIIGRPSVDV